MGSRKPRRTRRTCALAFSLFRNNNNNNKCSLLLGKKWKISEKRGRLLTWALGESTQASAHPAERALVSLGPSKRRPLRGLLLANNNKKPVSRQRQFGRFGRRAFNARAGDQTDDDDDIGNRNNFWLWLAARRPIRPASQPAKQVGCGATLRACSSGGGSGGKRALPGRLPRPALSALGSARSTACCAGRIASNPADELEPEARSTNRWQQERRLHGAPSLPRPSLRGQPLQGAAGEL